MRTASRNLRAAKKPLITTASRREAGVITGSDDAAAGKLPPGSKSEKGRILNYDERDTNEVIFGS